MKSTSLLNITNEEKRENNPIKMDKSISIFAYKKSSDFFPFG